MKAYQLKIQIKNSHPPIWRRLIVPAGLSFSQLAVVLNEAMGWCGYHLFSFKFHRLGIEIEDEIEEYDDIRWFDCEMEEAGETMIDSYLDTEEWFTYLYDFGDEWQHRVTVEKVLHDYDKNYARVLKYKGETPYEDCGGIDEYYHLMEILENPKHPKYKEMKAWTETHFQMEYDLEMVNRRLKDLYLSEEESAPMTRIEIYQEILEGDKPLKKINPDLEGLPFIDDAFGMDEEKWKNASLKDVFDTYTKEELMEIVKIHGLRGYSKLKKEQIIEHLCEELLTEDVMQRYFCYISDEEMELLESDENFMQTELWDGEYNTLPEGGYAGFKYVFGEEYICVPEEVKEAYRRNCGAEWKRLRTPARELVQYMNLAAELYGICPIEKLLEIYERFTGKKKSAFEVVQFAKEIPLNKKYFILRKGKIILELVEKEEVSKDLLSVQGNLDFYIPTKEEAEALMEKGWLPFNRAMIKLQMFFLKNGEDTEEDAAQLCKHIQVIIRTGGSPEAIMDMLEECFMGYEEMVENNRKLDMFSKLLMDVIVSTRMIAYRGHTPEEVLPKKTPPKNDKIIRFPGR